MNIFLISKNYYKIILYISIDCVIICFVIKNGVWLNLVERCIRVAEAMSSNLVTPIKTQNLTIHLIRYAVRRSLIIIGRLNVS